MNANVMNSGVIPAGLFFGSEFFSHNNRNFILQKGSVSAEYPLHIQQLMMDEFKEDRKGHQYLKRMGVEKFSKGFEQWKFCKFGGIDSTPDYNEETHSLTPDAFNNACNSTTCELRGKFCGVQSGITRIDFETLQYVIAGFTDQKTGNILHLQTSTIKSRIEVLRLKLGANSKADLAAKAAAYGIRPRLNKNIA